ncbi:MAG: hypothetical protein KIT09_12180 [Bryobacteraceae bacterium]|nr:hypothetical protein [Bryobacteraceae bacterium]
MPLSPAPPWKNPRLLVLLLSVFLCGSLAGALTMKLCSPVRSARAQSDWTPDSRTKMLERFQKELDLTPAQTQGFQQVLDDFGKYYHTLQAQMAEVRGEGRRTMLKILTPEQQKKFKRMGEELQDKMPR